MCEVWRTIPNTVDSSNTLLGVIQSGLVVSGNSSITTAVVGTSGDALTSQTVSGKTYFIYMKNARNTTNPLLGGTFDEIADYVEVEISHRGVYANTSSSRTAVRTMVDDFKITLASGSFSNPPRPYLVGETWALPHEKIAKVTLTYRFRYLL